MESEGERDRHETNRQGREEADQKARLEGRKGLPHLYFQNEKGVLEKSALLSSPASWSGPRIFQQTFLCSKIKAPIAQALIRFFWE